MTRSKILEATSGKNVEGWEINYFLAKSLNKRSYPDIRSVMGDLESWLEVQG